MDKVTLMGFTGFNDIYWFYCVHVFRLSSAFYASTFNYVLLISLVMHVQNDSNAF